jgi:DNA-directed RNA polymerase beta' subunit
VLTEDEYRQAVEKYGNAASEAMMGADAVRELIGARPDELAASSAEAAQDPNSASRRSRTRQAAEARREIRNSENDPAWMVMDVVPVIPPDLRPLVLLESGNFATSDLNDLYRRIINRNNRLKKLMDLNAPEVIIRNEKRMLQQAVDALFDNNRCRRPVLGSSNRPLKSLTDMIKGKQGRFRENLLGKRVDYSARSVIVVGPELKLTSAACPRRSPWSSTSRSSSASSRSTASRTRSRAPSGCSSAATPRCGTSSKRSSTSTRCCSTAPRRSTAWASRPSSRCSWKATRSAAPARLRRLQRRLRRRPDGGPPAAVVEAQAEAHVLMLSTHNIFSPANGGRSSRRRRTSCWASTSSPSARTT